jgi:hypothetical protein
MDSILILLIFIACVCFLFSSIYYYKYTNLKKTKIPLYKLKDVFIHNPKTYPTSDKTKVITIDTLLSLINNPDVPY